MTNPINPITRYKDRPSPHDMVDVSLDIETLSKENNAVVISIGAAINDTGDHIYEFYEFCNLHDQTQWKRDVDGATCVWHMQHNVTRFCHNIASMGEVSTVKTILTRLHLFFEQLDKPACVWMNSPRFDAAILQSLAEDAEMELPWEYWQEEDLRTIRTLAELRAPELYAALPDPPNDAHDALADAIYQLEIISRCKTILNC